MAHGELLPWLEANEGSLGFGVRTAQRLIKAAANATLASHLDAPEALSVPALRR